LRNPHSEKSLGAAKKIRFRDRIFFVFEEVYEPAEDTFLIAEHLKTSGHVLEIGTGCGILSILAALQSDHVVATDINPQAVRCARLNAEINGVSEKIDLLVGDLFSPLRENSTFNVILFNAPYLPEEEREGCESKSLIDYAWSGGKDGRSIIDRFIQQAPEHLRPGGSILLVQSTLSDVEKTILEFRKRRLQAKIIAERKFLFESITLIEAVKPRRID